VKNRVRFEAVTEIAMKNVIFWDVTTCSLVEAVKFCGSSVGNVTVFEVPTAVTRNGTVFWEKITYIRTEFR
jgi:hypothetical protein